MDVARSDRVQPVANGVEEPPFGVEVNPADEIIKQIRQVLCRQQIDAQGGQQQQ
jgi:hypothetical protein